ncbi:MAG: hypothetical protein V1733_00835 [bacterium]
MWQNSITAIIVLTVIGIAGYRLIRYFTNPLRKCNGCEKSCGGCALEELKRTKDDGRI